MKSLILVLLCLTLALSTELKTGSQAEACCTSPSALTGKYSKSYWQTGHAFEVGSGSRTDTYTVTFATPLCYTPVVHVGLNGVDADHSVNLRITLDVQNVSSTGFQVVATTWADTHIYGLYFNWLALLAFTS